MTYTSNEEWMEDVGCSINQIASALRALGNGGAATDMGAIENLAKELRDGSSAIASAISELAESIREAAPKA